MFSLLSHLHIQYVTSPWQRDNSIVITKMQIQSFLVLLMCSSFWVSWGSCLLYVVCRSFFLEAIYSKIESAVTSCTRYKNILENNNVLHISLKEKGLSGEPGGPHHKSEPLPFFLFGHLGIGQTYLQTLLFPNPSVPDLATFSLTFSITIMSVLPASWRVSYNAHSPQIRCQ